jgi:hypothetical protein
MQKKEIENGSTNVVADKKATESPTTMTISEEDPTLASVMQRLAQDGWKTFHFGVLWWTQDNEATALTLTQYSESAVELNSIVTFDPEKRKKGSGGRTLRGLLGVLDELTIGCYLRAVPPKEWGPLCRFRPRSERGLGKRSLKAWYKRHGFAPASGEKGLRPDVMYRPPRTPGITNVNRNTEEKSATSA